MAKGRRGLSRLSKESKLEGRRVEGTTDLLRPSIPSSTLQRSFDRSFERSFDRSFDRSFASFASFASFD